MEVEWQQPQLPDMPIERGRVIAPRELHFRYIIDHLIEVELVHPDHRQTIIETWRGEEYGT